MATKPKAQTMAVKVYHGYGHMHDLIVYGHVFKNRAAPERRYTNNILSNIIHLLGLFFLKPLAGVKLQLKWNDQVLNSMTEEDGFFKFEWSSKMDVPAGWHKVLVSALDDEGKIVSCGEGKIFVPHITQYGFISDIDDTVMVSHSSTIFRRLVTLFTKNPQSRRAFENIAHHYRLLAYAHSEPDVPNPFFYVSSSEWNLYNDLVDFFRHNKLPDGVFLLSQFKRWNELLKTGKTKHEGKLLRVYRILKAFPRQKFILFGDNSQADPSIYNTIAKKKPANIRAIYIRNVVGKNESATRQILQEAEHLGIAVCVFDDNAEAMAHGKSIGLLD